MIWKGGNVPVESPQVCHVKTPQVCHVKSPPVVFSQVVVAQVVVMPVSVFPVVRFPVSGAVFQVPSADTPKINTPKLAKITNHTSFFCCIIFVYIIKLFSPKVESHSIYTIEVPFQHKNCPNSAWKCSAKTYHYVEIFFYFLYCEENGPEDTCSFETRYRRT